MENSLIKVSAALNLKAGTANEKYIQLKNCFKELSHNPQKAMQITIKHSLNQSCKVGGHCGFKKSFWIEVMAEYLKDN